MSRGKVLYLHESRVKTVGKNLHQPFLIFRYFIQVLAPEKEMGGEGGDGGGTMCCGGPDPLKLRNFENGSSGLFK